MEMIGKWACQKHLLNQKYSLESSSKLQSCDCCTTFDRFPEHHLFCCRLPRFLISVRASLSVTQPHSIHQMTSSHYVQLIKLVFHSKIDRGYKNDNLLVLK